MDVFVDVAPEIAGVFIVVIAIALFAWRDYVNSTKQD